MVLLIALLLTNLFKQLVHLFNCLQDSQDDVEDGDENSELECSNSLWDSERGRNDVVQYDDAVPDIKPLNTMSHSVVNSNRIQNVSIKRILG